VASIIVCEDFAIKIRKEWVGANFGKPKESNDETADEDLNEKDGGRVRLAVNKGLVSEGVTGVIIKVVEVRFEGSVFSIWPGGPEEK
jgi:hypothetical protein